MKSKYYDEEVRLAQRLCPKKTKEEIDHYIRLCEYSHTYFEKLELIDLLYNFKLLKLEMKYEEMLAELEENSAALDYDTHCGRFSEISNEWDKEIFYETRRTEELKRRALEEYSKRTSEGPEDPSSPYSII